METIKVEVSGKCYLLLNLTTQFATELKTNSQKLSTHFHRCLENGSNIRALDASSSTNITNENPTKQKFAFFCGSFDKRNFIYGVKFGSHPWHYFDEIDSISTEHGSLPASVDTSIGLMTKVGTIYADLDDCVAHNYFKNDAFIFKGKLLKTYLTINGKPVVKDDNKKPEKKTKHLIFKSGRTNPLLFLNDFEGCVDVKSDNDKMYRILHFVDECHKGTFTKLYFDGDWASVKSEFLKLYSLSFVRNKRQNLDISFGEATSLRSFVELKVESLTTFTTLPFLNQIEIIMNDLPEEISKDEILNFCDTIQDLVEATISRPNEHLQESGQPSDRMEVDVFNFQPKNQSTLPGSSRGRGRGRGSVLRSTTKKVSSKKRKVQSEFENGSPERMGSIVEESESSDYGFLQEIDNTSKSSWSE